MAQVDGIILDPAGPIATVTFNRPERANCIDGNWLRPMQQFFENVARDGNVRAVLIKATGKHFMAGGDLRVSAQVRHVPPPEQFGTFMEMVECWNRMMAAMVAVPQPIIARVHGGVVGASVGLVAACDIVMAGEDAFFFIPQAQLGGAIDGLVTYFLPRQIGVQKARYLCLTGERVGALEAERLGLFSRVVPNDELEAATEQIASRMATGAPVTYGLIKKLINTSLDHSLEDHALLEAVLTARSSTTDWQAMNPALNAS